MPGSPHEARTQRQWAPPSPVAYSAYGLDPAAPSLELKRTQAALGAAHSSSADGSKVNSRSGGAKLGRAPQLRPPSVEDRKSTRLNSSHGSISYAVFCLKKKKKKNEA